MLGINSSTCRTEKCVGAELRSKVNFLNEIEIAADGLDQPTEGKWSRWYPRACSEGLCLSISKGIC